MTIICCIYESGHRYPSGDIPDGIVVKDILRLRAQNFALTDIVAGASVILVHEGEKDAGFIWENVAKHAPPTCLLVTYTDGFPALSRSDHNGERTWSLSHAAVEKNLYRFLGEWARTEEPDRNIFANFPCSDLSKAIHSLRNLTLPLAMDIEALNDAGPDSTITVGEIWSDYFQSTKPFGYLTSKRLFSAGNRGIEQEMLRILESIRWIPRIRDTEILRPFCTRVKELSKTMIAKELGVTTVRREAHNIKDDPVRLAEQLNLVVASVSGFANELRRIRDEEEAEQERQS